MSVSDHEVLKNVNYFSNPTVFPTVFVLFYSTSVRIYSKILNLDSSKSTLGRHRVSPITGVILASGGTFLVSEDVPGAVTELICRSPDSVRINY